MSASRCATLDRAIDQGHACEDVLQVASPLPLCEASRGTGLAPQPVHPQENIGHVNEGVERHGQEGREAGDRDFRVVLIAHLDRDTFKNTSVDSGHAEAAGQGHVEEGLPRLRLHLEP